MFFMPCGPWVQPGNYLAAPGTLQRLLKSVRWMPALLGHSVQPTNFQTTVSQEQIRIQVNLLTSLVASDRMVAISVDWCNCGKAREEERGGGWEGGGGEGGGGGLDGHDYT